MEEIWEEVNKKGEVDELALRDDKMQLPKLNLIGTSV
jgi:hypothetical protein